MQIGKYVEQPGGFNSFVPNKFPPNGFDIEMDETLVSLLTQATRMLGKLDGVTQLLPDVDFFIFMYVRKEAALSSQIEGTKATMMDAMNAEAEFTQGLPDDVDKIRKYIDAMNYGLNRLSTLPLSLRLISEVHGSLLIGELAKTPGEFRKSQNWIGGSSPKSARYVPPPVDEMKNALHDLESFLVDGSSMDVLLKTGLAHAQFETIHPFLDGNGRTGRLLITFFLCQQELLEQPVLYLSAYFKKHRDTYFDLLHDYHNRGAVEPWLKFFLEGVAMVAEDAINVSKRINNLHKRDVIRIQSLGKATEAGMVVLQNLYRLPIVDVGKVAEWLNYSRAGANKFVKRLEEIGILKQVDAERDYGRKFIYREYLDIFTEE